MTAVVVVVGFCKKIVTAATVIPSCSLVKKSNFIPIASCSFSIERQTVSEETEGQ